MEESKKLTRVATRIAKDRVAISYKQFFNQYMKYNSPFMVVVKEDKNIEIPDMNTKDEDFEIFYRALANKLLDPAMVNKVKMVFKKPQEKIPVNVMRSVPMADRIMEFAKQIVHKFDSGLEARLKAKYGRS